VSGVGFIGAAKIATQLKSIFARIAVALGNRHNFNRTKHWPVFYTFLSEKKRFVVGLVFARASQQRAGSGHWVPYQSGGQRPNDNLLLAKAGRPL